MNTCTIANCGFPTVARGYCSMHYSRWRKSGTAERHYPTACQVPGCPVGGRLRRGMCDAHYMQWYRRQALV